MLKHVMRAGDAFENPAFVLQAELYVAAVGEHPVPDQAVVDSEDLGSPFRGLAHPTLAVADDQDLERHTLERVPLGDAINLLLHRAGGVDVDGDGRHGSLFAFLTVMARFLLAIHALFLKKTQAAGRFSRAGM
jgi:hypothetical protein